ncbi:hypothetical protein [Klenkia brasiliensis]|uniref:Uncharacterized protein n=1 Tax=Klenkia brasiliensis TaxID=333142 RepID=A0A1G7QLQ9_9ACTN|nr:hypothetical protein [Klenkia brasiliensis]SDF99487.1 hypothetical protein SAMN05660324_1531 [Klenkia brasiliensis]
MEPTDPRRTGTRRVRLVTAAVAGGALVGTGALTVAVAQAHPAAAEDAAPSGAVTTDGGTTTGPGGGSRPVPPSSGVGNGSGGHAHTSSGSS